MERLTDYGNPDLTGFLDLMRRERWEWMAKRLSGNDTGLTGGHQAGLYLPRRFFRKAVPGIVTTDRPNPDACFECLQLPDRRECRLRAIYYNNRHFSNSSGGRGSRNEFRLTRWGGCSSLQDPDNTGAVVILFWKENRLISRLAVNEEEEELLLDFIGIEVEPGQFCFSDRIEPEMPLFARQSPGELVRPEWLERFPTGRELADAAIAAIRPSADLSADELLMRRRNLETRLFYDMERRHVEPLLGSFRTIEEFISVANSVTNRRKSRLGRSLEHHLAAIFGERGLRFEEQARTELNKKPDFLFPSSEVYSQPEPELPLFMLAAKTCCKDRWRQVTSEADRIPEKHLFTLQEGVSENQMREMLDQRVRLVIPGGNRKRFPAAVRGELLDLEQFITLVAGSQRPS